MRVLITGGGGQVGQALVTGAPTAATVFALGHDELDITQPDSIAAAMERFSPDIVINTAAYTAVDRAETERGQAFKVNAEAVGHLARICSEAGCRLLHVSTDFVFDGRQSRPYAPGDAPGPLGVYGASKHAGEEAAGTRALIVRTAWVYAAQGHNFVHTMLELMARRDEVRVIADQVGTPTHAASLASALWALAGQGAAGIHHYTDAGTASWYDFAVAIMEEAVAMGLLGRAISVVPIATSDYPLPARRPAYSVLDCRATWAAIGGPPPHWRESLRHMLREIEANG